MMVLSRIKSCFVKSKPAVHIEPLNDNRKLREFVYLDEVSLRSLLSSQKGEVTDGKSEQEIDSFGSELATTIGAQTPLIAKAEMASKFQTTNSSTIQTSRKATVQSWFREFHDLPNLRLIEPVEDVRPVPNLDDLALLEDMSVRVPVSKLLRGELVEFRVRLNADPVFRLGTMVSEFTGMAEDHAAMFDEGDTLASLGEAHRINKILQRLLAGLIPIRADAVDYRSIDLGGRECLVHRDAISSLDIQSRRVQIVGVTEHLAFWKDIRRVLFSDAEFTMLCRISRSGLQPSWTPVKLADMFREIAPDLVDQLNAAGRTPLGSQPVPQKPTEDPTEMRLFEALRRYADALVTEWGRTLNTDQSASLEDFIVEMRGRALTATGHREAFSAVGKLLAAMLGETILAGPRDLKMREDARLDSGLSLFPLIGREKPLTGQAVQVPDDTDPPRLLDVEVVAIYW